MHYMCKCMDCSLRYDTNAYNSNMHDMFIQKYTSSLASITISYFLDIKVRPNMVPTLLSHMPSKRPACLLLINLALIHTRQPSSFA